MGGTVDLVILEVVEVQAVVASEEALEVQAVVVSEEALVVEAVLVVVPVAEVQAGGALAAVVLAVVPVGQEDNLSNI